MKISKMVSASILLLSISQASFSRDGTLPLILEGSSFAVPNSSETLFPTTLTFNDDAELLEQDLNCSIRDNDNNVSKEKAAGMIKIGPVKYAVLGTCSNATTNEYELIAVDALTLSAANGVSFIGKVVTENNTVIYKGVLTVKGQRSAQKLKFELK